MTEELAEAGVEGAVTKFSFDLFGLKGESKLVSGRGAVWGTKPPPLLDFRK